MRVRFRFYNVLIIIVGFVFILTLTFSLMGSQSNKTDKNDVGGLVTQIESLFLSIRDAHLTHQERTSALNTVKRLLNEHLNEQNNRSKNLNQFVNQLLQGMNVSMLLNSSSITDLAPPTMFNYMPHLLVHMEALNASLKLSKARRGVSLVFGIPTIYRPTSSYLEQTLTSVIQSLSPEEKDKVLIVVFIAEGYSNKSTYINNTVRMIQNSFPKELTSGLLDVVVPSTNYYPLLKDIKLTFGDNEERVRWRVKQNLDYAYLMLYCQSRGSLYMQLEDDIITKPGFYAKIQSRVASIKSNDWLLIEFSMLGFIGKLFKSRDLPWIVEFFLSFYKDKPIDWLLDHIFYVKYCSPEKSMKICNSLVNSKYRLIHKPSLFQHIGLHSSLKGKIQKLKDKTFVINKGKNYINPEADITTSIVTYKTYKIDRMYKGMNYFWGIMPVKNDYVKIEFEVPISLNSYSISTGLPDHIDDILTNTSVYIKPITPPGDLIANSDGFFKIGEFLPGDHGLSKGDIDKKFGKLQILKLVIEQESKSWVIINELRLFPTKK